MLRNRMPMSNLGKNKENGMRKIAYPLIGMLIVASCDSTVSAQEERPSGDGWRASLGISYRSFGDMDLKPFEFTPGQDRFINGSVTEMGAGMYRYGVVDSVRQVDNINRDLVEYQTASMTKYETGIKEAPGMILEFSREMRRTETVSWHLNLSLATAFVDDVSTIGAQTSAFRFDIAPQKWPEAQGQPGGGPDPAVTTQTFFNTYNKAVLPTPMSEVNARVSYEFDCSMYTLGAGISAEKDIGDFRCNLGTGPTLSFVSSDITRRAQASWADDGTTFYDSGNESTTDHAVQPGVYAEAGIAWQVSQTLSLAFSGRYDWIPEDLDTAFADFELSGYTGSFLLSYSF